MVLVDKSTTGPDHCHTIASDDRGPDDVALIGRRCRDGGADCCRSWGQTALVLGRNAGEYEQMGGVQWPRRRGRCDGCGSRDDGEWQCGWGGVFGLVLMRPPCPKWITRLLAMPGLQIGSKSIERNTSILGGFGGIFSDRFGFLIADLENRRTDANRTPNSASKSARNRLDRTGLWSISRKSHRDWSNCSWRRFQGQQ